jgi:hypothetical protein
VGEAAANSAELGIDGPVVGEKCAPESVERHVALSVPVAQWAHTTPVVGSSKSHGRPFAGVAWRVKLTPASWETPSAAPAPDPTEPAVGFGPAYARRQRAASST